ncbi:UvrD-helicase domain-containing protein [Thiorhodovibrio frisius]|uniref:DNA 3'-5' helicase n=1 Tax=Thiorhodovibrio frisius TaxID=631362 RepID=H8Z2S9_9GAMM|nr:ATP-dependent helicase [Thiorhodovibrio frisius]EIC21665.1 DNA/RNA helicase, superfamily I [Thiorhodovibrio frisius]WPL21634.1 DNA helicase II [Thiorhodovibrio frisius]
MTKKVKIVQAVAGSGKTTLLKKEIETARNYDGLSPDQILFVTFSRKLAEELNREIGNQATVKNLHKLGFNLIRKNTSYFGFAKIPKLYHSSSERKLFRSVTRGFLSKTQAKDFFKARQKGQSRKEICQSLNLDEAIIKKLLKEFSKQKKKRNVCSFTDMTLLGSKACWAWSKNKNVSFQPPRLLCVDEFQDLNDAEKLFIRRLITVSEKGIIVGDDRQAIYSFKGASFNAVSKLKDEIPNCQYETLDRSYRLTMETAALVNACENTEGYPRIKSLRPGCKPLFLECSSRREGLDAAAIEIKRLLDDGVSPKAIACITKFKKDFRQFQSFLVKNGVPVKVSKLAADELEVIEHFLYYLEIILDENESNRMLVSYLQDYLDLSEEQATSICSNIDARITGKELGIDDSTRRKTRDRLNGIITLDEKCSFERVLRIFTKKFQGKLDGSFHLAIKNLLGRYGLLENYEIASDDPKVKIETLKKSIEQFLESENDTIYVNTQHSAKGRTFDHVFLIDIFEGNISYKFKKWSKREESNLFHVALTRARERLYLVFFKEDLGFENKQKEKSEKKRRQVGKHERQLISFLPDRSLISKYCEVKTL